MTNVFTFLCFLIKKDKQIYFWKQIKAHSFNYFLQQKKPHSFCTSHSCWPPPTAGEYQRLSPEVQTELKRNTATKRFQKKQSHRQSLKEKHQRHKFRWQQIHHMIKIFEKRTQSWVVNDTESIWRLGSNQYPSPCTFKTSEHWFDFQKS